MKILITGHKCFIGKNLLKYLKEKRYDVYGFDIKTNKKIPNLAKYDWVIHLGAISSTTEKNVEKVLNYNYLFSKKILEKCIKSKTNLQYASSASLYDIKFGFSEKSKCLPKSPYSWSKYLFDRKVLKILKTKNTKIKIQGFRYFNVYGENEKNKKNQASPIYKFYVQSLKKKIFIFKNSHKYKRDFVYINDVCKVQEQMLKKNVSGLYNIGTGKTKSFEEVAIEIAKTNKSKISYIDMPDDIKDHYQKFTKADNKKIMKLVDINWKNPIKLIKTNSLNFEL